MTGTLAWVRRHPLMVYVLLAYAFSWAYWWPLVLTGHVVRLGSSVTQFPGLLGPAIAGVIVTGLTAGASGLRELRARVCRWRVPTRWWMFALVSPLAVVGLALLVMALISDRPDLAGFARMAGLPQLPTLVGVFFVWAMLVFVNGLGEETGWRGFALPQLRRRHGLLASSLVLVPIWAGWHLPLFFLLQNYRDLGAIGVPGFLFSLTCGSILLAWLYDSAHSSILVVAVWHGTYNLTTATAAGHGLVAAAVSTVVILAALVVGWRIRHRGSDDEHLDCLPAGTSRAAGLDPAAYPLAGD